MAITRFAENPTVETRALQIYHILIGAASRRETLTYGGLATKLGFRGAGVMASFLEPIMRWCRNNGLPALTAIVVNQDTGIPGHGLTTVPGGDFPAEQQLVFPFDWYAIQPPMREDLL